MYDFSCICLKLCISDVLSLLDTPAINAIIYSEYI